MPAIAHQVENAGGSGGLGIVDADLYVPKLNFMFGLASSQSRVAVIALARLHNPDPEMFVQRCVKEAIHELGHAILGLRHCLDRSYVMAFSNSLADTDYKGTSFCARCSVTRLSSAIRSKKATHS